MTSETWTGLNQSLRDGIAAAHMRDFDRARSLLADADMQSPGSALVWFWKAIASESAAPAMRCLRRVLEIDSSHTQARDALGRLLLAQALTIAERDREGACRLLVEASQLDPTVEAVWLALARLAGTLAEQLNALRRAAALSPHRADVRTRLHDAVLRYAVERARQGDKAGARVLFREAADLQPGDARVWQALARLADAPADAVEALRALVRIAPDHAGSRAALKQALAAHARALQAARHNAEAVARWREALTLDGRDVDLWLGLAGASADDTEVRQAVEAAYRLDPARRETLAWMARFNPAPAPAQPSRRMVMVVDDSPTIRKIVGLTLERAGYAVVAEADGERAVARLAELVPDLILLDITMPKLDGYEVCRRIRKDTRTAHVPVVMLSGKDGFFDKVKGRMVGATEYLTKPFQASEVLAVIASHCQAGPEVARG